MSRLEKKESYAVGIDVGGSSLKCGLVNSEGEIVYSFLMPSNQVLTEGEIIALINAAIRKCVEYAPSAISGIGIGFPGIVEQNIIIGGANNLPGFKNVNLGEIISGSTGLPVVVDNDANMMAWGEGCYGAAVNCTDVVFLTIGTGIGGSLILNGKLYGGYKNRGTELGHIIIDHTGKPCSCGALGCFEAYASVSALVSRYAGLSGIDKESLNGKIIIRNYLASEPAAVQAMEEHFKYAATGIASLINIFSPQKVVIGGGIAEAGEFYIEKIREGVLKLAMPDTLSNTTLVSANLGNKAGLLGCAGRVFSELSTPQSFYNAS